MPETAASSKSAWFVNYTRSTGSYLTKKSEKASTPPCRKVQKNTNWGCCCAASTPDPPTRDGPTSSSNSEENSPISEELLTQTPPRPWRAIHGEEVQQDSHRSAARRASLASSKLLLFCPISPALSALPSPGSSSPFCSLCVPAFPRLSQALSCFCVPSEPWRGLHCPPYPSPSGSRSAGDSSAPPDSSRERCESEVSSCSRRAKKHVLAVLWLVWLVDHVCRENRRTCERCTERRSFAVGERSSLGYDWAVRRRGRLRRQPKAVLWVAGHVRD